VCVHDLPTATDSCLSGLTRVFSFDWSPDGTSVLVGGPGRLPVQIVDVDTGTHSVVLPPGGTDSVRRALEAAGHGRPVQFVMPLWSPSGRFVAALASVVGGDAAYVPVIVGLDGRFVAMGQPSTEFGEGFRWSPVEDLIAYTKGRAPYTTTGIFVLDADTGRDRLVRSTVGERAFINTLAWSPSGRWLALAGGVIVDVTGSSPPMEIRLSGGDVLDWGP
jgi:WD40 repeat protein